MLLAEADWLDQWDKIASIASAIISLLSLLAVLLQSRQAAADMQERADGRRRWRASFVLICAVVAVASAALVIWVASDQLRAAGVVVGGLACVAGLVVVVSGAISWLRSPKRLNPSLRRLLRAQLSEGDLHQYTFGSLPLPGVSLIYVEQRVGSIDARGATAPRILDVKALVGHAPSAIVIGVPGAGKSTLAAHLTSEAAKWWSQARVWSAVRSAPFGRVIPVLVPARALTDADLPDAIARHWSQASVDAELFVGDPFRNVQWLIVVDSIDEISAGNARARVVQRLGTFLASNPNGRLLVTTRALTAGELADLTSRGAKEFQLRLFGPKELLRFAANWFTVRGGGQVDADAEAARFLAHLRSSQLISVVRVPLLATMAILVYEADRDRALPTGRADLYREFVCQLSGARDTTPVTPFETWLVQRLDDLLATLATAHVWESAPRLLPLAIDWVATNAPAHLLDGPESERIGALRSTLISSGLCVFSPSHDPDEDVPGVDLRIRDGLHVGNDVEFIHLTIAEYLAADGSRYAFSYDSFRDLMSNGSTRGFALFTLARGGTEASEIVGLLLNDDDPVAAGRVIADCIAVDGELRDRVIAGLLERIRQDHPTVSDCVSVLTDLANAPDVEDRLRAVVEDDSQGLWMRVVLADALADVATETGIDLLRGLTNSAHARESDAGWWAEQRLAARAGHPLRADEPVLVVPHPSALGEIGRQAYRQTVAENHQDPRVRARAAGALHAINDDVGTAVLRELALDRHAPVDLRLSTARMLAADGDRQGLAALRALAEAGAHVPTPVPTAIRYSAAMELVAHDEYEGFEVVRQLVRSQDMPTTERRQLAAQLVHRGDPLGRSVITRLDRAHARRTVAVRMIGVVLAVLGPAALTGVATDDHSVPGSAAVTGVVGVAIALVALWFAGAGVPISAFARFARTPGVPERRSSRGTPYGAARMQSTLEHLAARVSRDLAAQSVATLGGSNGLRLNVRPVGRRDLGNMAEATVLPLNLTTIAAQRAAGPVVVLGSFGSGKTQAVTTAALEFLDQRGGDEPVPVLLPLARWDGTNRHLADWIATELASRYAMSIALATDLVAGRRVLPILDGLDEVPSAHRRAAATAIDALAAEGRTVVVTCRTEVYRDPSAELALRSALILEMQPVQAADVVDYLRASTTDDEFPAWRSVISELQSGASGPFADIMATPLTATIALRPYLRTDRSPTELLRRLYARDRSDATPASALLDDYIPSAVVNMDRFPPQRSITWLRTIALHMSDAGTDEFTWWNVRNLVPARVLNLLLTLAISLVVLTTITTGLAANVTRSPTGAAAVVMFLGLAIVTTQSPWRTPPGRNPQESLRLAALNAVGGTLILSAACALLAYAATGRLKDAIVLAIIPLGFAWTTHFGQYLLSLLYLAKTRLLPTRLLAFLDATTRARITIEVGPMYRFVHDALRDALVRRPASP